VCRRLLVPSSRSPDDALEGDESGCGRVPAVFARMQIIFKKGAVSALVSFQFATGLKFKLAIAYILVIT